MPRAELLALKDSLTAKRSLGLSWIRACGVGGQSGFGPQQASLSQRVRRENPIEARGSLVGAHASVVGLVDICIPVSYIDG